MTQDQTTENATGTLHAYTGEAASVVGSVAADLQAVAARTYDATVAEVKSQANDAKTNAANDVKDVATALRRASEDMRGGSAQERTLGQIASTLADASDALRNKDLGEILQAASRVARENPILFLSGAALLGFAASRYAKASSSQGSVSGAGQSPQDNFSAQGEGNVPIHGHAFAFARNETPEGNRDDWAPT